MASLTGSTIASSYEQLLALPDGGLNGNTLVAITDGDSSVAIGMKVATNKIEIIPGSDDANAFEVSKADGTAVLTVNTSTAGATLTGAFDITGKQTITTSDNLDTLTLINTDTDVNTGPNIEFYRNSASPANNDYLGRMRYTGRNDNSQDVNYVVMDTQAIAVADGSETGSWNLQTMKGGALDQRIRVNGDETVLNDEPKDVDFRVESTGNANMLFVDAGNNKVGIGTGSPAEMLHVASDAIFDGHIKVDSNTKGLVLGADQDMTLFANAPGEMFITRGTDVTPALGDTEGWFAFAAGDSSASYMQVFGGEGGDALLYMYADGGDDDADKWRMSASTGGNFLISGAASGSFLDFVGISGSGNMVKNKQAAFQATPSSSQDNFAINSNVTVVFGTEVFDQGGNFASNTFTAPATGKYQLNVNLRVEQIDSAANYYHLKIGTSNRDYAFIFDPENGGTDRLYNNMGFSVLADMDTNDTATVVINQSAGTAQSDISTESYFSGFLAC